MKITASKSQLVALLGRCATVSSAKHQMPVLRNVLLRTTPDGLEASATDLIVSVRGSVECEVSVAGEICAPAKDLLERVKLMPDGGVALESVDGTLTIKSTSGARRFSIGTVDAIEFPALPDGASDSPMAVSTDMLLGLIGSVQHAVSTDETRLHLNSALLGFGSGGMVMVGTDGHRLATASAHLDSSADTSLLIPLRGLIELRRLLSDSTDPTVALSRAGHDLLAETGGYRLSVRLVDAKFPPYQQVIPESSEATVSLDRLDLMAALRAVSVASSATTRGVLCSLSDGVMSITGSSPDSGDGSDSVSCEHSGPAREVGLNASYLLDALSSVDSERVDLGISGALDPVVLSAGGFIAVVMPMRV